MATKVNEVIDLVTRSSYSIPIGTEPGMKRMKKAMCSSLNKSIIEDEFSIVKKVDFRTIEDRIWNGEDFETGHLCVDVMPKLDVRRLQISRVNLKLADAFKLEFIDLNSHNGKQKWDQYGIPVRDVSNQKGCYLVYNIRGGKLRYPSFKAYHSPVINFNCYENMEFGKGVVKIVYDTLSELIAKAAKR